jgi:ketosteroid isomerase-like protein
MNLSRADILSRFHVWLMAWNEYDLDGVMEFMHEDIVFENWDGSIISGKQSLARSWALWFRHRDFQFIQEDLFIDEEAQKIAFTWHLEWPSPEKKYSGKKEIRRGVDILHLLEGKIDKKNTYSKNTLSIDLVPVRLCTV